MPRKTYTLSMEPEIVQAAKVKAGLIPFSRLVESLLKDFLRQDGSGHDQMQRGGA